MKNRELKILLKEAKLTKKELSEMFNISHQAVKNWGTSQGIPYWVELFLQNYIKAKKYDELMEKLQEASQKI